MLYLFYFKKITMLHFLNSNTKYLTCRLLVFYVLKVHIYLICIQILRIDKNFRKFNPLFIWYKQTLFAFIKIKAGTTSYLPKLKKQPFLLILENSFLKSAQTFMKKEQTSFSFYSSTPFVPKF